MASELGKQLLARVQEEMARNISTVKNQFVEWLERPETGGNLSLKDHLMEISGGLSLLGQNEAAELSNAICNGIDYLNTKIVPNIESKSAEFAVGGSELASALLILADYIEQLGEDHHEENKNFLLQSTATIGSICENGEKKVSPSLQKPVVSKDTYQAIGEKVSEILDISRYQIEQNVQAGDYSFQTAALIENHNELLSLFDVLNFKAPQLLLKQINQMLESAETEEQWIEIAEAILLVDSALKQIKLTDIQKNIGAFAEALQSQIGHSRNLEIKKLIKETGISYGKFFEELRKTIIHDNRIHNDQPWQEAIHNLKDYASILGLVGFSELAKQLQHLGLVYAEISLQPEEVTKKLYPFIVDSLVAVEYLTNDLASSSEVLDQDVKFLQNTINSIVQKCKITDQAKRLFADTAKEEETDTSSDRDILHVDESFAAGLAALDNDFSALEIKHLDDIDEKSDENAEELDITRVSVVSSPVGGQSSSEASPVSSISITPASKESLQNEAQDFAPSEGGNIAGAPFFANKSISDLEALDVPQEKSSFMESHADAVVDDEIREFFIEEFVEIIAAMNEVYPKWCESPEDGQLTNDIRRHFHTLKGSGRTVGYEALGECAWQHEQLLNRVIDKDYPANSLVRETVGDAIDLLNILEKQEEFVEYKGALLQQALVAEKVRNTLLDGKESNQEKLDQLSSTLRLGGGNGRGAPASSLGQSPEPQSAPELQPDDLFNTTSDWAQADELADLDLSLDDHKAPSVAAAPPTGGQSSTGSISLDPNVEKTGSKSDIEKLPIGVMPGSYKEMLSTLQSGLPNANDKTAVSALAETIGHQWQKRSSLQDPKVRAEMAKKFAETTNSDVSFMGEVLNQAAQIMAKEEKKQQASSTMPVTDDVFDFSDSSSKSLESSMSTAVSADLGFTEHHDDPIGSVGIDINNQQSNEQAVSNIPTESEDHAYQRALSTLKRAFADGTPDEDTQAALAGVIASQLDTQHLTSPEVLNALEQKLLAGLSDTAVDKNVISQLVEKVGSQQSGEPVASAQNEDADLSPEVYEKMLNTLRRGLARNADDEDLQDALVSTLLNQWSTKQGAANALPEEVATKLASNLMQEGNVNESALMQIIGKMTNQATEQQPSFEVPATVTASSIPEGIDDEGYNRMLNTLRRGLMVGGADKDMQEVLTETVSRQWNDYGIEAEGETRDNIISHLKQSLINEGVAKGEVIDDLLSNVPAFSDPSLPEGVERAAYQQIASTLEGLSVSSSADELATLATNVAAQWEQKETLQDATTRAEVAAMLAEKTDGDVQTIGEVLDQAASHAQKVEEYGRLPAGVEPSAYEEVASALGGISANSSADELTAVAENIAAQWEQKETLQDATARAEVAAMLAEKTDGDVQTIGEVLDQATSQAQKDAEYAALPKDVIPEAYEKVLSTVSQLSDDATVGEFQSAISSIVSQWERKASLQNPNSRSVVAELMSKRTDKDFKEIENVLSRAAKYAQKNTATTTTQSSNEALNSATAHHSWSSLPDGVTPETYEKIASAIAHSAHGSDVATIASDIAQHKEIGASLQSDVARTGIAQMLAETTDHNVEMLEDILAQAANHLQMPNAAEEFPQDALPEGVTPEIYQQLLSTLQSHLSPANPAANFSDLINDLAGQSNAQESLQNPAVRESIAQIMSEVMHSDAGIITDLLTQAAARSKVSPTTEQVVEEFEIVEESPQVSGSAADIDFDLPAPDNHSADDFIDVKMPSAPSISIDAPATEGNHFIDAAPQPEIKHPIKNPTKQAVPAAINPRERLQQELQSLSQTNSPAPNSGALAPSSTSEKRAVFLRAVDQFESLSQLAEKEESPEIIDDLINSVYDIEDSIDSETSPAWIWRLLDSIEQLLLMYKHQGLPVTLSCAEILRQSAGLIEHHDEENSEDEAMDAINSLMNARKNTALPQSADNPFNPNANNELITPLPKGSGYSTELLWGEMVADPNANTVLAETFLDEAMAIFAHSQEEAERWDENRNHLGRLDSIRRNMHTLKGSARMAGYMAIGDLTHGVESLLDAIVDGHAEGNGKAAALLIGAMWQGMLMLDNIRDGFLPQTDPYIINNIHEFLGQPLPYPEVSTHSTEALVANITEAKTREEATLTEEKLPEEQTPLEMEVSPVDTTEREENPPAEATEEMNVEEAEDDAQSGEKEAADDEPLEKPVEFDENIDPVLVDIFTDEAQELLETTSNLFEEGDFSHSATIEELQRTMHTLKGGARLVGFTAIGDTAHLMESVIDKIPELPDSKVRQAKTLLNMGLDTHYEMLDSVMRHEMPRPATDLNEALKTFAETGQFINPAQKAAEKPVEAKKPEESKPPKEEKAVPAPEISKEPTQAELAPKSVDQEPQQQVAKEAKSADLEQSTVSSRKEDQTAQPEQEQAAPKEAEDHPEPVKDVEVPPVEQPTKPERPQEQEPPKEEDNPVELPKQEEKTLPRTDEKKEKFKEPQTSDLPRYVRVDAQLLDEMIAMIGETAIMRSRIENVAAEAEFNLNELTRVVSRVAEQMRRLDSETEAQILYRREQQGEDDEHFDPLEMDRFSEIQQLSRQLSESIDDLKNLQETLSHDNSILRNISTQQGVVQRSIQDRLLTTQLMRFDVHEPRLKRLIKQTAKSVGKEVNFVLEGGEVELERRLLEDILPALEHMIRNSLAHGIEKPADRLAVGKSEVGTVKLVVEAHASELSVRLIDDGQGLNYDRIREKAAAKGMLDPERANDEAYLSSLILRSGFSTAESLSQLSGRGVGMDVVNEIIKQRRGQILAHSIQGQGTEFTLKMPFSMSIAEVLLVEIAGQVFAAPMSSIAAISQVDKDALQSSFAGEVVYQHYNEMDYRLFVLGAYFKPEQYEFSPEENSAPVLFINAGGSPVAFHVDRILNRLEIIVKNVNRQVLNIPGISGATILGDGRVVPVLELLDLSRRIANLTPTSQFPVEEEVDTTKNILVVDDSVTMRKVSTRLLERNHYNVATAKDGLDAIDVLEGFIPDLIMLDIEMPRMDGFEFAAHVRNNSQVPDVPIVMITSRTGDKHRERADQIGVQGYLGKPYSEDKLIETLEALLGK